MSDGARRDVAVAGVGGEGGRRKLENSFFCLPTSTVLWRYSSSGSFLPSSYLVFHDYFPKLRVTVHLIITVPHRVFKREVFSSASNYKTRTLTTTRLHDPLRGAPPEASVPPPFSPLPLSRPSPSSSPHLLPSRLAPSRLAPSRLASSPYAALAIAPTPRWAFS